MAAHLASDELQRRVRLRLTDALVTDYLRDGAVCIRQLVGIDELALLRDGIESNLARPSARAKIASRTDDPGRFFEDFCNWRDIPQYRRFIFESPWAWVAQRLMQSRTVRRYHDHLLVEEPATRQRTPWHQDQPYYNIEGWQNISMWIAVDPVPRESTLEFVAGSHLGPWLMPRSFMDQQAKWFAEGSLADLPDIEADRSKHPIVGWDVEPGDVVCFNMLTLHVAAGVRGTRRRRVFSLRLMGDDTRHAPQAWKTSPDFPGLADRLAPGAPMDDPLFPMLVDGA